jgi:hypothetical protein
MKAEGTRFALVQNTTVGPDQVKSIRPSGIGGLDLVIEAIDHRRKLDAEFAHARAGDRSAFGLVFWTSEEDFVADIALHLPDVGWVGLKNIDRVKVRLALVLLRQFVQGGNLPPKGRSSIAAENQHHRSFRPKGAEFYWGFVFELLDGQAWRDVAGLDCPSARVRPHGLEGKEEIGGHRHAGHDMPEDLWRLPHGPIDVTDEADPKDEEHHRGSAQPSFRLVAHLDLHSAGLNPSVCSFQDNSAVERQKHQRRG